MGSRTAQVTSPAPAGCDEVSQSAAEAAARKEVKCPKLVPVH